MTLDEFNRTAKRTEDEAFVTYDVRPFKDQQQGAVAVFLGNLIFRLSVSSLNTSKTVQLLVDNRFVSTPQLDGFVEKLKESGLSIDVSCPRPADANG